MCSSSWIKFLEDLQYKAIKNEDAKKDEDIARLTFENKNLEEKLVEQNDTIKDLQSSINIKMEVSKSLNKQLGETKAKAGKEKAAILKEHKAEVKSWRKCLGEERKLKIKLEKELELSKETITNIILSDDDHNQTIEVEVVENEELDVKDDNENFVDRPCPTFFSPPRLSTARSLPSSSASPHREDFTLSEYPLYRNFPRKIAI